MTQFNQVGHIGRTSLIAPYAIRRAAHTAKQVGPEVNPIVDACTYKVNAATLGESSEWPKRSYRKSRYQLGLCHRIFVLDGGGSQPHP